MRQKACARILLVMVVGAVWVMAGCSDAEILDEPEDSYTYSMELMDADEEGMLTIDIVQDDCDGNFATTDDLEFFTDLFATVTVNVAATAPGLSLDYYRLEYIPLASPDSNGNLVTAPTVGSSMRGYVNLDIDSGETGIITLTMMTTDTKSQIAVDSGVWGGTADPDKLRYTMRVTLYFEDYGGDERKFVLEKTVYFGWYWNC